MLGCAKQINSTVGITFLQRDRTGHVGRVAFFFIPIHWTDKWGGFHSIHHLIIILLYHPQWLTFSLVKPTHFLFQFSATHASLFPFGTLSDRSCWESAINTHLTNLSFQYVSRGDKTAYARHGGDKLHTWHYTAEDELLKLLHDISSTPPPHRIKYLCSHIKQNEVWGKFHKNQPNKPDRRQFGPSCINRQFDHGHC